MRQLLCIASCLLLLRASQGLIIGGDCEKGECINGNCIENRCSCFEGWTGPFCDQSTGNDCIEFPCQNGGTCVPIDFGGERLARAVNPEYYDEYDFGRSACKCPEGWRGVSCEVPANKSSCDPNPCMNGGQCIDVQYWYYCNCSEGFAGITCDKDIPVVSAALEETTLPTGDVVNILQFSCNFTPLNNTDTLYTVYWYVDNMVKKVSYDVTTAELDSTRLNETDLEHLGVNITCQVVYDGEIHDNTSPPPGPLARVKRMRVNPRGDSRYPHSKPFYAGIKILNPRIQANRGDTIDIILQLTVPFGCYPGTEPCTLTVLFSDPDVGECAGSVGVTGSQSCGLSISSDQWNDTYRITVTVKDSGTYQLAKPFYTVQLRTDDHPGHLIWSNYTLEEIYIGLDDIDVSWHGKDCHSVIDPHMAVFDGRRYENHNEGEFIMYLHDSLPFQVNMKTVACANGLSPTPTCGCGVAVRAGAEVFVIDTCPGENFIGFLSCDNRVLDVRKLSETRYQIYFPTGTYVSVQMYSQGFMNIYVYPSIRDVNSVRGLCGNLNGTCVDDFELRDGTYSTVASANANCRATSRWWPDDFSLSWRVGLAESLFVSSTFIDNLEQWGLGTEICTCTGSVPPVIECSHSNVETCSRDGKGDLACSIRQKRSLRRQQRSLSTYQESHHASLNARQRLHKRQTDPATWTELQRRTFCEQFLEAKQIFQVCGDIENVGKETAIDICMMDIELTKSTGWAFAALEAMKDKCQHEVKMDLDLRTPSAGGTSVAERVLAMLCQNECSGHGSCNNGECLCDYGFGAGDCSVDLSDPPILDENQADIKCDKATSECSETSIFGATFVDSGNLTCRIRVFKNLWNGQRIEEQTSIGVTGQHRSLFEVKCPLPAISSDDLEEGVYSYGYDITISNDGNVFGKQFATITMYDSDCLTPNSEVVDNNDRSDSSSSEENDDDSAFSLKRGKCVMRGSCKGIVLVPRNLHCRYCQSFGGRLSGLPRKEKDCKKKRRGWWWFRKSGWWGRG